MRHEGALHQGNEDIENCSCSSPPKGLSVMRKFLESGVEFTWSEDLGECRGNHCDLRPNKGIPLKWIRKISNDKASIDKYEAPSGSAFREAFVVKTLRGTNSQKVRTMTANEVNNMRDLRHPHISALLGTFDHQERLNILIFPAACCDLHQYMKQLSKEIQRVREQSLPPHVFHRDVSPSSGTSTQDSTTNCSLHSHGPELATNKHTTIENCEDKPKAWPLLLCVDCKIRLLRRYFVCLSQALSYLHESGVRHKDIKPKNILIDESGCVVLTDFGISRRFPKDKSHVTNNEWNFTRKYASPEIMKDKRMPRDDPSDVFSLGCVFLEMATLLLGENLTRFSEYYTTTVNISAKEEAYYCNLDRVYSWIDHLKTLNEIKPVKDNWRRGAICKAQDIILSSNDNMVASLVDIRRMLDEVPSNRPLSKTLWQQFQGISSEQCKDCDPRQTEGVWEPSIRQQENAKTGLINRRSMLVEKELDFEAKEPFRYGEIDSTLLSAHNMLDRSDRGQPQGSSPSTSLRSFSRRDNSKAIPRPRSPISQEPLERPGSAGRTERSTSPRLHISATHEEITNAEELRTSIQMAPVSITDNPALNDQPQGVSGTEAIHSRPRSRSSGLGAANGDSRSPPAFNQITNSQAMQTQANNQEKAKYQDDTPKTIEEAMPKPQEAILVYDVAQTIAFKTVFADLKGMFSPLSRSLLFDVILSIQGREYKAYPLPRTGQQVEIGERPKLIAKVNLRQLGWGTRVRRWKGHYPKIYVLNRAAHPLQSGQANNMIQGSRALATSC